MSVVSRYFEAVEKLVDEIRQAESERILRAAEICAESVAKGGVVHIHDTGHMLNSELVHRAGGLALLTPFSFSLNVNNPNAFREKNPSSDDLTSETIALALKRSNIKPGDVLFIGSVSGKSRSVIELALQAKGMGVTVIAITSFDYSSKLQSEHPSGKRLFEVADLAIDNHAPYADAMLEIEGLDVKACPASGIAAACIMWAVTAGIVQGLLDRGIVPTVYRSVNAPGGPEDVKARQERYKQLGY
ncbi:MAG: sugar isomerase domain-containing protein [Armatimonadota bacterium]|nr:sugar isomerase domain-containing protein [Armatimonadota bacterium]